ncbi:MAG TPA: sensor domain-containing diguanylate cyclase [Acidimicrobiales bacterium]|jgi:diguanylate cyclase (GGDEF)-like protein
MEHLRRWVSLAALVAVLVAAGGAGLALTVGADHKAQAIHQNDRLSLQQTLGGLGSQFLLLALKDEDDTASTGPWALQAGSAADAARLTAFAHRSALLTYGAAVVDLSGGPLTAVAPGGPLPPPSDPGYRVLAALLKSGKPGLTPVMHVGRVPVVALGVPVMVAGVPRALLLGYFRADTSPLEVYVEGLHYGHTGQDYVLDASGGIVAATNPAQVGTRMPASGPLVAVQHGQTGFRQYKQGGHQLVASYTPLAVGGWVSMTTQSAGEFFGPIQLGVERVEVALLVLLALASVIVVVLTYKRATARREYQERLTHMAHHDTLTGLVNRQLFTETMQAALARARRHDRGVAVLYVDLDGFKGVNDKLGHDVGDQLLLEVADRLRGCVRAGDVVARIGGDEFTVVMEDVASAELARTIADRIVVELARPVVMGEHSTTVGGSVGVAFSPDGQDSVEGLLRNADLAMYRAKDGGGSRTQVHELSGDRVS